MERQLFNVGFWAHDLHRPNNLLLAWVPKSQYFYVQEAIDVSMLGHFNWPEASFVADKFSVVNQIFTEPQVIGESKVVIDFSIRQQHLSQIMHEAEAHSEIYYFK